MSKTSKIKIMEGSVYYKRKRKAIQLSDTLTPGWRSLVSKYAGLAKEELCAVYTQITKGQGPQPNLATVQFETNDDILKLYDAQYVYIYTDPEARDVKKNKRRICFGSDCLPYPVFDKTLWPLKTNYKTTWPELHRDVLGKILQYLPPAQVIQMALISKKWYRVARAESTWYYFKSRLIYYFPFLAEVFEAGFATWKVFRAKLMFTDDLKDLNTRKVTRRFKKLPSILKRVVLNAHVPWPKVDTKVLKDDVTAFKVEFLYDENVTKQRMFMYKSLTKLECYFWMNPESWRLRWAQGLFEPWHYFMHHYQLHKNDVHLHQIGSLAAYVIYDPNFFSPYERKDLEKYGF